VAITDANTRIPCKERPKAISNIIKSSAKLALEK
jgi:hypothetical protein